MHVSSHSPACRASHVQCCKQVQRAVALVRALHALNNLAAAGFDVASGALQRLYRWLFVNADHQRVLRRVEIQSNHVCGLGAELRIGADTPGPVTLKLDALFAQNPPNRVVGNIQRLGQTARDSQA